MIKNNIKKILDEKGISMNKMSEDLGWSYKTTHELVKRDNLFHTKLGMIVQISEYLEVKVEDLYKQ